MPVPTRFILEETITLEISTTSCVCGKHRITGSHCGKSTTTVTCLFTASFQEN